LSKQRLRKLEEEVKHKREEESVLLAEWEKEKKALNEAKVGGGAVHVIHLKLSYSDSFWYLLTVVQNAKKELEKLKFEAEQAQRRGDFARAGELTYGLIPVSIGVHSSVN